MDEQPVVKTLWIYTYSRGADDVMHMVYAVDEAEAWVQAREWVSTRTDPIYSETLEAAPRGCCVGHMYAEGSLRCLPDGTPLANP